MSAAAVIDSLEFATAEQELTGHVPIKSLKRLEDVLLDKEGYVSFELHGSHDRRHRPLLKLHVWGLLQLRCQRCLEVLHYPLDFESVLLVVPQGSRPDDAAEPTAPDYVEADAEFDVSSLIEEEMLLSLPFSSRHEHACEEKLDGTKTEERASPFAALAALKNPGKR